MKTIDFTLEIFTYIVQLITIIYLITSVFYAYNIRTKMNKRNAIALSSISVGLIFGILLHVYAVTYCQKDLQVSIMFSVNQILVCFGTGGIVYNFLIRKLSIKPYQKIIRFFCKSY